MTDGGTYEESSPSRCKDRGQDFFDVKGRVHFVHIKEKATTQRDGNN